MCRSTGTASRSGPRAAGLSCCSSTAWPAVRRPGGTSSRRWRSASRWSRPICSDTASRASRGAASTRSARMPTCCATCCNLLGHPSATFVGQSLGGGVAMQLAYQFPERCERLVLVGSGGLGREVNVVAAGADAAGCRLRLPARVCAAATRCRQLDCGAPAPHRSARRPGGRRDLAQLRVARRRRHPPLLLPHSARRHRLRRPSGERHRPLVPDVACFRR